MPEISVILPTLRPQLALRCIRRIAETSKDVDYEVVVVSSADIESLPDECPERSRIRLIREAEREGSCKANTLGYLHARGKYVFALADDHLLAKDCLKNLLLFMRPHDHELFLSGVRTYGPTGPGHEHRAYGMYYPYNPCIRRDLVEQVGGFYDPYYRCYWGDPDLALRVWSRGGRADLCLDAWLEVANATDKLDADSHADFGERDYARFVRRWHPIYGARAKTDRFEDINVRESDVKPGLPPDLCVRLQRHLWTREWTALEDDLRDPRGAFFNTDFLPYVMEAAIPNLLFAPRYTRSRLVSWLCQQLSPNGSMPETTRPAKILARPDEIQSRFLARAVHFLLADAARRRDASLALEDYKGVNVVCHRGRYYSWPCAFGGFSTEAAERSNDPIALSADTLSGVIKHIDTRIPTRRNFSEEELETLSGLSISSGKPEAATLHALENSPNELCALVLCALRQRHWEAAADYLRRSVRGRWTAVEHLPSVFDEACRRRSELPPELARLLAGWFTVLLEGGHVVPWRRTASAWYGLISRLKRTLITSNPSLKGAIHARA